MPDYQTPKVSVVLGVRNEYPVILGTMMSVVEELEFWGYPWEIIVVDNLSTDNTADILEDKFRRWVRHGLLKVIRWNDRPANVTVRNVGARKATGDVVFLGDGHLSIKIGTFHGMIQGWLKRGGLWHSAIHIWGDTSNIRCYGYDLKLEERFWGNLSRGIPDEVFEDPKKKTNPRPYRVPMASHCCLMAGREEYLDFRGYCENFRCYGGGEPYLDLLWWIFGKEVWLYPQGLIRHAFGVNARWETAPKDKKTRNKVHRRDGVQTQDLKEGDEYLRYSRGYNWTNEQFHYNFMLSAYCIGGYAWLRKRYEAYWEMRKGNSRYLEDLKQLRREVLHEGAETRAFIESRQVMTLDDLLEKKPWENFADL
ncbi:MAG: glycosyltransferase family 2 protein [Candidatus Latescibacterota bacterium]|nr:MAG: glycosyltransferase family 2 protein [Candidatus Latescibacterota bacterium]